MKEQLIEFETAKLAKEKGFDWEVLNHYNNELFYNDEFVNNKGYLFEDDVKNSELEPFEYSAPTQSLLQKWLRDEHDCLVEITTAGKDEHYVKVLLPDIMSPYFEPEQESIGDVDFETYEQALEAGLIEALKLI